MQPWFTQSAITFLETFFTKNSSARMLELGSGNSTAWFGARTQELISIEHDERWYARTTNACAHLPHVSVRLMRSNYAQICDTFPDNYFDIIVIDGKDRVQCSEKAQRILKPGGIVMLDDAERPRYAPIFDMFKSWPCTITEELKATPLGAQELSKTVWWVKLH